MPRPRADQQGPSAQERLEAAFWGLLAERPCADLTVAALSAHARVNHNTFYYYFANIDDMAEQLFERNLLPDLPRRVLGTFSTRSPGQEDTTDWPVEVSADVRAHFARAVLFARSGSVTLTDILKRSLTSLWLEAAGVDAARLSPGQRDQLEFVFGGLVAVLAVPGNEVTPERLAELMGSPLGHGLLTSLRAIAQGA